MSLFMVTHQDIYRPQRSCGQGYVFTRVCDSVHRGGDSAEPPGRETPRDQADTPPRTWQTPPGRENPPSRETPSGPGRHTPPQDQADPPAGRAPWENPPGRETPQDQADTPRDQTPLAGRPPREEDCSIRSMSGRYASYWNAFLLCFFFNLSNLAPNGW